MKRFIKNNLKVFVTLVISGIVFTGIGVYAASQYLARDISFTPINENFKKENGESIENVEDALNELYEKVDDNLEIIFQAQGVGTYSDSVLDVLKKYKYFKITFVSKKNAKDCYPRYWFSSTNNGQLAFDTIYETKDYNTILLSSYSLDSKTQNQCRTKINFFNNL